MNAEKVKKVYRWYAKWYDRTFTRKVWRVLFAQAEKEFIQVLKKYVQLDGSVLDVGVGTGVNIGRFLENGIAFRSYKGVDLTPEMVAVAKQKFDGVKNLTFQEGDITKISIGDKYNTIISTLVFSHLSKQDEVVRKLLGALLPKGVFILMDFTVRTSPLSRWERMTIPIWSIFQFKPILGNVVAKFLATETRKDFLCPGGQMSIFVFRAR